jgi:hypothetical protein
VTDFLQLVSTLREQMNATLSRSDVLRPLSWLIGILAVMTLGLVAAKAEQWTIAVGMILLVVSILIYGGAYLYCLLHDRDALRSEKYTLQKLAIEHGYFGDNRTGLIDRGNNNTKQISGTESPPQGETGS